jgi:hypothetical protein
MNEFAPPHHVLVHDSWTLDPGTGLNRPSVVKCNWFKRIKKVKIQGTLGYLDDDQFGRIVDEFLRILDDPDFSDWIGPKPDFSD